MFLDLEKSEREIINQQSPHSPNISSRWRRKKVNYWKWKKKSLRIEKKESTNRNTLRLN